MPHDPRLTRLDATRLRVKNPHGVDAVLFANEQVPVEAAAVTELIEFLDLQKTVERIAEVWLGRAGPYASTYPPNDR